MLYFWRRIHHKSKKLLFYYLNKSKFKFLSKTATFISPTRFDGKGGIKIGDYSFIQSGAWLYCCGIDGFEANLSIGSNCEFGYNNHIASIQNVSIGDFVLTANNVYISDNIHEYLDVNKPIIRQSIRFKGAVNIGDGAWIGENVCIIGASIGKNSVIGANSVVTRDVPDFCVAVGSPARVIRKFDVELQKWIDCK
jgi:acetyltransferase-like isoleucine patch superfamily enzyme